MECHFIIASDSVNHLPVTDHPKPGFLAGRPRRTVGDGWKHAQALLESQRAAWVARRSPTSFLQSRIVLSAMAVSIKEETAVHNCVEVWHCRLLRCIDGFLVSREGSIDFSLQTLVGVAMCSKEVKQVAHVDGSRIGTWKVLRRLDSCLRSVILTSDNDKSRVRRNRQLVSWFPRFFVGSRLPANGELVMNSLSSSVSPGGTRCLRRQIWIHSVP